MTRSRGVFLKDSAPSSARVGKVPTLIFALSEHYNDSVVLADDRAEDHDVFQFGDRRIERVESPEGHGEESARRGLTGAADS